MSLIRPYKDVRDWNFSLAPSVSQKLTIELEQGLVLYLPFLSYELFNQQRHLMDAKYLNSKSQYISYNPNNQHCRGIIKNGLIKQEYQTLLSDFSNHTRKLVNKLFPAYQSALELGLTRFLPAQINRDDTHLHVDAYSAKPVQGKRILQVFSNINPTHQARRWQIGQPLDAVLNQFLPKISKPFLGQHQLLKLFGFTKTKRSLYDHYMVNVHDKMKADLAYQKSAISEQFDFPSNTTWIAFTDLVSHAEISGQHLLEQTFYLPVRAQIHPELSPLKKMEKQLEAACV